MANKNGSETKKKKKYFCIACSHSFDKPLTKKGETEEVCPRCRRYNSWGARTS